MKLRIKDNSIRLRLSQTEVETLHTLGQLTATIQFSRHPLTELHYRIRRDDNISEIRTTYQESYVTVGIPAFQLKEWTTTDLVSMEHFQSLSPTEDLRILIEKDFKCLQVRPHEDESDMFPHPTGHC